MRFRDQYEASQFEEWKRQYLKYVSIKNHIHQLFPFKPSDDHAQAQNDVEHINGGDGGHASLLSRAERGDIILTKLLSELHKIDQFYRAVEGELTVGFQSLRAQSNIRASAETDGAASHRSTRACTSQSEQRSPERSRRRHYR